MTLSSSTYYQWYIKNILHQVKDNYLHLIELPVKVTMVLHMNNIIYNIILSVWDSTYRTLITDL